MNGGMNEVTFVHHQKKLSGLAHLPGTRRLLSSFLRAFLLAIGASNGGIHSTDPDAMKIYAKLPHHSVAQ